MKIAVFASSTSKQARLVFENLRNCIDENDELHFMDTELPVSEAVSIDGKELIWNGVDLSSLDCAYVHGFKHEEPVIPVERDCDWSLWQPAHVLDQQRHSFLYSLFTRMEADGVKLFNAPAVHVSAFNKFSQLNSLKKAGVNIPDMICTNDKAAASRFMDKHEDVLWRTATGRCSWQLFTNKQLDALITPEKPPILLANICSGLIRRAYFIEGRPALVLENSAPEMERMEELEVFSVVDALEAEKIVKKITETLNTRWCQVTFVSSDGEPIVYDVDVDPLLNDMPLKLSEYLNACLTEELIGKPQTKDLLKDKYYSRDSLFLRRMLQIQFSMQATKYQSMPEKTL